MSNGSGRFMFAGHVIGAAARFHRLDDLTNLNHVIPTQGASVLPVTGGRTHSRLPQKPFRFDVQEPRPRCLLEIADLETWVEGRDANGSHQTELSVDVTGLHVVEKLHIDNLRLHMLVVRDASGVPVVTTTGNSITGMRLNNVEVRMTIDDDPIAHTGTADQLAAYYQGKGQQLPQYGDHYRCSLVRDIQLIGAQKDKTDMTVEGNTIVWVGFGRIILGEVHVKGHERRLTMVRLAMGSDAGGSGSAGDGQSNGSPGTG